MYQLVTPLFIRNITPMHVGSGNDLGFVDLPIQREKHTQYPKIEASSLKGCIREYFEDNANSLKDVYMVHNLFGYDKDSLNRCLDVNVKKEDIAKVKTDFESDKKRSQFAGAVGFTDARILFFPVKSVKGVFSYVTCPAVLNKWIEEMNLGKKDQNESRLSFISQVEEEEAACFKGSELAVEQTKEKKKYVILEDYMFKYRELSDEKEFLSNYMKKYLGMIITNIDSFMQHVAIINDDDFKDFVNLSTEVITRTKIDNSTGTVKDGALFNEEYLPTETIMYCLAMYSPAFSSISPDGEQGKIITAEEVKSEFERIFNTNDEQSAICMQIGSGATIGKGLCKLGKSGDIK